MISSLSRPTVLPNRCADKPLTGLTPACAATDVHPAALPSKVQFGRHSPQRTLGALVACVAAILGIATAGAIVGDQASQDSVGTVQGPWGGTRAYVKPDHSVVSNWNLNQGTFDANGDVFSSGWGVRRGRVTPDGQIYRQTLLGDQLWATVNAQGEVRGATLGGYCGKVDGNLTLQQKGQVALLTILQDD